VPEVTGAAGAIACGAPGDPGAPAAQEAAAHPKHLEVVPLPEANNGGVWLPTRWGVERRKAWAARLRRGARDDDRWAETRAGMSWPLRS
jgi:hypothetical protein